MQEVASSYSPLARISLIQLYGVYTKARVQCEMNYHLYECSGRLKESNRLRLNTRKAKLILGLPGFREILLVLDEDVIPRQNLCTIQESLYMPSSHL